MPLHAYGPRTAGEQVQRVPVETSWDRDQVLHRRASPAADPRAAKTDESWKRPVSPRDPHGLDATDQVILGVVAGGFKPDAGQPVCLLEQRYCVALAHRVPTN